MEIRYMIYQILDIKHTDYVFMPWKHAKDKFQRMDYTPAFAAELETKNTDSLSILEELFELLNVGDAPENYHKVARNLSTSDVVGLMFDDHTEYWYCDSFGWQNITEIQKTQMETETED